MSFWPHRPTISELQAAHPGRGYSSFRLADLGRVRVGDGPWIPEPPKHYLCIHEEPGYDRDWEIEHTEECQVIDRTCPSYLTSLYDTLEIPLRWLEWQCNVGDLISHAGSDAIAEFDELGPGRWELEFVTEHTPSLPTNGGEEWYAWIEVVW